MPVLYILLIAGTIFLLTRKKKTAKIFYINALALFFLSSTGLFPTLATRYLESHYEPLMHPLQNEGNNPIHVLVLGGGHRSDPRLPANNQLSLSALGRLVEGIRLHKMNPGSRLILSGFSGRDTQSNAEVMYQAALLLGVDADKMAIIPKPENTRQEAVFYKKRFGNGNELIIVSSATHIPRAMIWFRKAGLSPIASPTNHSIKEGLHRREWWMPSASFIEKTDRAVYETAGIIQAILTPAHVMKQP